jgi:hypothetical protein
MTPTHTVTGQALAGRPIGDNQKPHRAVALLAEQRRRCEGPARPSDSPPTCPTANCRARDTPVMHGIVVVASNANAPLLLLAD